jgi:hypothetical protein
MAGKPTLKGINRVITVDVTQPIVDRAEKGDSGHCMIADAVRAAIPEAKSVSVDVVSIRFTDPAKRQRYIYLTPRVAQLALINFDQGVRTQPFRFQLKKAVQVVESGHRTASDGTRKRPSRAVQKVVGTSGRNWPVKLGGEAPAVGALSSKPSKSKQVAAATAGRATTAKVPGKKPTAAEKRAAATRTAKAQAAARDRGEPAGAQSNVTLSQTATRIRSFGMKQLRP